MRAHPIKSRTPVKASRAIIASWAVLLAVWTGAADAPENKVLSGHVPPALSRLVPVARLPSSSRLALVLGLPLRNQGELNSLLGQLYDPANTNYHHYLTPEQFTDKFGPAEQDYQAVIAFANSNHLTVTATHPNRTLLDVEGAVRDIENAFHLSLRVYHHPTEARDFYAPDKEPSLDRAVPIQAISGLDNYFLPHPTSLRAGPKPVSGVTPLAGSGPSGTYLGDDFRAAYMPGVALTGVGQRLGLLEFDGYYTNDIAAYETQASLPNVALTNVLLDGFNGTPGVNDDEVSLDIEMAIAAAPGLAQVIVYEAGSNGFGNDILNRMATDNLAKQLSASWLYPINTNTDQIFKQFAAQGQSYFNASGDFDAYTGTIPTPAAETNITIVGGTSLTTSGPGGTWLSEEVWNFGYSSIGSSGGISTNPIPPWQQGIDMSTNHGSTTMRNIPDVALTADNIWVAFGNGNSGTFAGTSCATPLWAGFIALANQQAAANHHPPVGFINPAIYAIGKSNIYAACFHDIINGNNTNSSSPNLFYAVPGYDLCTGWGTPRGVSLINALTPPDPLQITPATGFSAIGPSGGPFNQTSQTFVLTNLGTTSFTWTQTCTVPWLTAFPAGGILSHKGSSSVTVSLNQTATNLNSGIYSGTVWFTNRNTGIVQNRRFSLQVSQSLLQNGGFETGNFSRWTEAQISSNLTHVSTNSLYVHSGKYGAALGSVGSLSYLSQVVPTAPGQTYLLSLWLDSPDGKTNNEFLVSWNHVTLFDQVNLGAIGWTYLQSVVTATTTNTTLAFGYRDDLSFLGLDDVSLTFVPLPALRALHPNGDILTLTWSALPGVRYQVQDRANIVHADWHDFGPVVTATNSTASISDRAGAQQRFYRLVLLP